MPSNEHIRILFAEHLTKDLEMAKRAIKKESIVFTCKVVEKELDFRQQLIEFKPDIVVSEYIMPTFDGISAMNISKDLSPQTPFIILTSSGNENTAVACMKAGANDYVIKKQIKRLPFAIKEAIEKTLVQEDKIRIESQLRNLLEEFRDLINGMDETVWILNTEGKLLDVNNSATDTLGYSRKELLELGIFGIDNHLNRKEIKKLIEIIQTDKKQFFQTVYTTKEGIEIPVEINSTLINYRGKPAILNVGRNISERIRTEDKLRLLSRSVDQSPIAIFITNKDGIIEYVNHSFTKISGYDLNEVYGKNPRILKSGKHSTSFYKNLWDTILSGNDWYGEVVNKRKDGSLYWEEVSISPVLNNEGKITHFISLRVDINEKKKMIEELVAAKEKAEESDRLKSAFLANMSHEIRTPMNGILGFTSLLSQPNLSGKDQERYIEIIQKSGERMLNTVNDIIEISKIETGQVKISTNQININRHLIILATFFQPEYEKKGLNLVIENTVDENDAEIQIDKVKFESVVTNLIKNAIKFTSKGTIKIGCKLKDGMLEIFVRDTGIGIPVNKLDSVFERFVQVDVGHSRGYEGSGLGLAISKSYIEMLGGKIWVESKVEKGSTFYFTIPYDPVQPKIERKLTEIIDSDLLIENKKLNILIVEDDASGRMYLETLLMNKCGKMIFATNGVEAIEKFQENKDIDLILMDLRMPVMDGYTAARKIKEIDNDIIIIAQTAFALTGDKEKALTEGCNDYISKPINKVDLFNLIQKHFTL